MVENPAYAILAGRNSPTVLSSGVPGDVAWTVHARMVDGQIRNPESGRMDKVRLRAYQGDSTRVAVPFVAPTVELAPGNTFRLTIVNELPRNDPSCAELTDNVNVPHCFNSTNMHTHGLWISPTGNSDNVLLKIVPGTTFTYEYNIPTDHPAGTFWYHPHLHGSTALQVSSGMAGAMIIKGNRFPDPTKNGDIDTLLVREDGSAFRERVVLLQQIQYACRDSNNKIKKTPAGAWVCDPSDVGTIEGYDQFGPTDWTKSGRFTTINGLVVPTFRDAVAGEPERWRVIHAGVRDSVNLRFHKVQLPEGTDLPRLSTRDEAGQADFVDDVCAPDPIDQYAMATDGLTRAAIRTQSAARLHPGYREDLLMVFPEPGNYCVIDGDAPGNETVSAVPKSRKLLGFVEVADGPAAGGDTRATLTDALVNAAQAYMPTDVASEIVADLRDGLKLTRFVPHPSLMDTRTDTIRRVGFFIDTAASPTSFEIGSFDDSGTLIDPKPFDPDVVNHLLPLGATEEWQIRSFLAGHPFHIHVNPFQIIEILDPDGNDVSTDDPGNTSIYAGLKGTWKDTIFATMTAGTPYRIKVRTRYQRYIGKYVLHCHILDHEDQGMMQIVEIGLPDGTGGVQSAHQH
ncbi:multicopper oxidase family protein [Tropicibacter sp. S64]|uniref:multicopper oxidase family protein n=1 Tax=Tropicibacter sp. S64 TaxID=3415122 RepID=UPI003C7BCD95